MPLSRFCAAALGAIILSCASNSFATGEDAPLPGDFQPPRQSKTISKPAPGNGGSNKANDVPARNIQPATTSKPQEKTTNPAEPPRQAKAEARRSQRSDSRPATRKSSRQLKQAAGTQRTAKARNAMRGGKQSVRSNKTVRASKKAAVRQRTAGKRTKAGKVIASRKAGTGQRSLAARKRQKATANATKRGVVAKRSARVKAKAGRTATKASLKQRQVRKTALKAGGKRGSVAQAKHHKTGAKVRRHKQPARQAHQAIRP